jgi:hypothetical protein
MLDPCWARCSGSDMGPETRHTKHNHIPQLWLQPMPFGAAYLMKSLRFILISAYVWPSSRATGMHRIRHPSNASMDTVFDTYQSHDGQSSIVAYVRVSSFTAIAPPSQRRRDGVVRSPWSRNGSGASPPTEREPPPLPSYSWDYPSPLPAGCSQSSPLPPSPLTVPHRAAPSPDSPHVGEGRSKCNASTRNAAHCRRTGGSASVEGYGDQGFSHMAPW